MVMTHDWSRGLTSISDLDRTDVLKLFKLVDNCIKGKYEKIGLGRVIGLLFFEPSTRTRLSFEVAAHKIGAYPLVVHDTSTLSISKGESMEDTLRILGNYCDILILRHKDPKTIRKAIRYAGVPVINAGSGSVEHPTQSLIDIYTVYKFRGNPDGLTFGIMGDLKHSRAVHSLIMLLTKFDNVKLKLISPKGLELDEPFRKSIESEIVLEEISDIRSIISELDVLYIVRLQKERFKENYEKYISSYSISPEILKKCKEDLLILAPLPRTWELPPSIDSLPQAKYFQQASFGVPVRMAILISILRAL